MDVAQATGPGGTDMLLGLGATKNSDGAHMDGDLQADTSNHGGLAHGIVMALATLVVAPIDVLTAGALRRWPVLHIITSTAMMAFILAGMGLGIQMSRLYIAVSSPGNTMTWRGGVAEVGWVLTSTLHRPNSTGQHTRS
jgi:hypothetical protein